MKVGMHVLCCSNCLFCMGYFVMVPLNLTDLHCLQHFFFEHLFNVYAVIHILSSTVEVVEKPVFGVALVTALEHSRSHDGIQLPAIFRECIDYIEEHGALSWW